MIIGTGTTAEMLLSSPNFGDEWLNTTYNKKFRYNGNVWLVPGEMSEYINRAGRTLLEGEFVILDSSTGGVTVTAAGTDVCTGVVVIGGANGLPVGVAIAGKDWKCLINNTVVVGNYLRDSTVVAGRWQGIGTMGMGRQMQALQAGVAGNLIKARFLIGENY